LQPPEGDQCQSQFPGKIIHQVYTTAICCLSICDQSGCESSHQESFRCTFHSIIRYGIIFWGNATDSCKVFRLQKRIIRLMLGARPRASCRGLFKKLEILPAPCQYILTD